MRLLSSSVNVAAVAPRILAQLAVAFLLLWLKFPQRQPLLQKACDVAYA